MNQGGMSKARRERLRRVFALYDVNHDGHIDEADFVLIYERLASTRRGPAPALELVRQAAKARFQTMAEADANGDGRITEDEFLAYAEKTHTGSALGPRSLELAQVTFRAWDADGDGAINLADSVHAHMAFGQNPRVADLVATFRLYDTDGDGLIQPGEFLEAYSRVLLSDDDDVPFMFATG